MNNGIAKEIDVLTDALKNDPAYYIGWQANIAMQFIDEWERTVNKGILPITRESIHLIANESAKNFLNLLIRS